MRDYPMLFHMAEDGTWPSIEARGLLSTQALVDLYNPEENLRAEILSKVRRTSIVLNDPTLGSAVIRDQRPLKFLDQCLLPGTSPEQFLHALNSRVFFWLTHERLERLLSAKLYRQKKHTVLHIDTAELVSRYGDKVQLAPFNTGSMHVPTAPPRGTDVFVDIDEYPHDTWRTKRGRNGDAVVELTVPYSVPDIADMTICVERWESGRPVETILNYNRRR